MGMDVSRKTALSPRPLPAIPHSTRLAPCCERVRDRGSFRDGEEKKGRNLVEPIGIEPTTS